MVYSYSLVFENNLLNIKVAKRMDIHSGFRQKFSDISQIEASVSTQVSSLMSL